MSSSKHIIAIIGGAVSGAEATKALTEQGVEVVVIEQNARPYGKIEDGLPRWHDKQRPKEYEKINSYLSQPSVHFIPLTKIGRDISFEDLQNWGFSMVILANGAWRDRPLGVDGIEDYTGKGFYYQNPFIYWFNHYHENNFLGEPCEIHDNAIVIGGGLASIDVVKILMIETLTRALKKKGIEVDPIEMEHKGCKKTLEDHNLTLEDLGVAPCTLYYRRRACDMPVAPKEEIRERLLNIAMDKYLFRFQGNSRPIDNIIENNHLVGLKFIKTEIKDGKVIDLPNSEFEIRSPLTISSVGSTPEPITGIPMKGEFYVWRDWDHGELESDKEVFGIGNVVTGKGNIMVSRKHGQTISKYILEEKLKNIPPLSEEQQGALVNKITARQQVVGYEGDYAAWIQQVSPADLK
jgi:ferredoxin/flavodoxin---NADP+ reductase